MIHTTWKRRLHYLMLILDPRFKYVTFVSVHLLIVLLPDFKLCPKIN